MAVPIAWPSRTTLRSPYPPVMPDLVGRERVVAVADAAIASALAGRGSLVAIAGPPGSGRSALLGAIGDRARVAGFRLLSGAAGPHDRETGLGVVRRLLFPLIEERPDLLEGGPAAWAAPLFQPGGGEVDHLAVSRGLLAILGRATDGGAPLAILVDDVHQADRSSHRILEELARAAVDLPVLVVVTATDTAPGSDAGVLAAAGSVLPIGPLAPPDIEALAVARLGGPVAPEVVDALAAASAGQPAIVVPILEALVDGRRPLAGNGASLPPIEAADIDQVAPAAMPAQVASRLESVSEPARALALAVAVLGGEARIDVAAAAAGLAPDAVAPRAAELIDAGLFGAAARPTWALSLLGRAARDLVPSGQRSLMAIGAARAMADAGDPADQVASLLIDAPAVGEPWAATVLAEAAGSAERHGAPEVAKDLWLRQLEEPLDLVARGWATASVARAEMHLGDPAGAARLRALAPLVDDPSLRCRVEFAAGRAYLWNADARTSTRCFADAADAAALAGDDQVERRSRAGQVLAASIGCLGLDAIGAARGHVGPLDASAGSSSLRAALAFADLIEGRPIAQVVADASLAVQDDRLYTLPTSDFTALTAAAFCLVGGGAPLDAVAVLDRVITAGHHLGQVATIATVQAGRASALVAAGLVSEAIDGAEAALDSGHAWPIELPAAAAALAEARRVQGDADTAAAALAEHPVAARDTELRTAQLQWLIVSGRVALDRGDADTALRLAERARAGGAVASTLGVDELMIRALVAGGEPQRAQEHADAALARPDVLRPALHGVVAVLRGRLAGDLGAVQAGVELVRSSGGVVELVDVLVVQGDELLRLGRRSDARAAFREALALADDLGLKGLASSALDGLRLAGGRPRRRALTGRSSLTPGEERICELVASGRSNREVADLLYVSRKTVEYHLGNAYGKLGISRREELAAALAPPDGSAPIRP
jgi:DNA-binding CsgD family transcriptional regulator